MKNIATALVKAQKEFGPALKTSTNPHFRSRYADLSACIEAVIDALNNNGIFLLQKNYDCADGIMVETVFVHESGEMLECGIVHFPATKKDPQGYASALTYGRRYSLMAACGIAPEDDDGQAASHQKAQKAEQKPEPAPVITAEQAADIEALISEVNADKKGLLEWVSQNTQTKVTKVEQIPNIAHVHVIRMLEKKKVQS